jgi:opacity protein-like surface antigen
MKVRTGALVALGLALVASPGYAQSITGGAKVGVNFAKVTGAGTEGTPDQKAGLVVGGFVEAAVTPQFSVQPEFLYSMKGAKDSSSSPEIKLNADVVEIPVLAKFKFATKSQAHPFVLGGPGFAFVTKAKITDGTNEIDLKDQDLVETFDTSFIIGGGVDISNILIEARYDWGLRDLDKTTDVAKDRTFSVLVGYSFGKKK